MDINLNFINNTNDANNSQIVIFQKNVAPTFGELHVAWKVIQRCGQGDNHPFTFPMEMQVGSSDAWGNFTPRFDAENGQRWAMTQTASGDVLGLDSDPSSDVTEVQLVNKLPVGAVAANIYKGGKLLATKTNVAPKQMAVFQFKPTIWIGVASQVVEGQVMNSAIISEVNTELSLLGIARADIVLTGGGPGQTSKPFQFSMQNVVMA